MLNKLELKKLPFVDDCPEADQKRIPWVRNGERLTAASTKYGNDGVLNAAGVGIHTNTLTLEENSEATKDTVNLLVDNVNNINAALEVGADTDIIRQITTNKENIEILQVHMQFAEENIGVLETDTQFLKEDVGAFDPLRDTHYRPVREDLLFVKTEMGAYPGQDINGLPVLGAPATGMKRRIIDNSSAIVQTIARVQQLEDDYQDSDVGSLSIRINEIRDELGPRIQATGTAVYTRLDALDTLTDQSEQTIEEIKTAIGLGPGPSVNTRVSALELKTTTLETSINQPVTGLKARVTNNEIEIGNDLTPTSIKGRLTSLRTDHNAVSQIVGADSSSGMRGQIAWLNLQVGEGASPPSDSIRGKIAVIETRTGQNTTAIQNIQADIGNSNTGLKGDVLKLSRQMNGTNPMGSTVEERGVILSIKQSDAKIAVMPQEAPLDGREYVRKSGDWVVSAAFDGAADIQTLKTDMAGVKADVVSLKDRADTIELQQGIDTAAISGLTARMVTAEGTIVTLDTDVSALKTENLMIKPDVDTLKTSMTEVKADIVNIKRDIADLQADIVRIDDALSHKIDEAPKDGQAYVRVDGTWVLLSTLLP